MPALGIRGSSQSLQCHPPELSLCLVSHWPALSSRAPFSMRTPPRFSEPPPPPSPDLHPQHVCFSTSVPLAYYSVPKGNLQLFVLWKRDLCLALSLGQEQRSASTSKKGDPSRRRSQGCAHCTLPQDRRVPQWTVKLGAGHFLPVLTGPLWLLCHGCCISSAVTSIPSLPAVKLFMSLHSFSKYLLNAAVQP